MANTRVSKQITAAGTVVLRENPDGQTEVLLVHRPRYQDWSLPKGKLDPDEYLVGCAARETREEAGVNVRLGIPLDPIQYPVSAGTKTVFYWRSRVVGNGRQKANGEVDDVAWFSLREALDLVTYADERPLIRQAVALPDSTPLLLIRHGKALPRSDWDGIDSERPLDERGRLQSQRLTPLLDAYGVGRLVSSTSARCLQTLLPHSHASGLVLEAEPALSEERFATEPKAVTPLLKRIAKQAAETGKPAAICGHRPVLPTMLAALKLAPRSLQPGSTLVVHLAPDASVLAVELHKPEV